MKSEVDLDTRLGSFRTHDLSLLPTPVHEMKNLAGHTVKNRRLFIKRDDLTGMAMGGNKNRKLDYILADIIGQKADTVITWGGIQSNWCRQVAAAAKMYHKKSILILLKKPGGSEEKRGNLMLDHLFGADIRIAEVTPDQKIMAFHDVRKLIKPVIDEVKNRGEIPYVLPIGGSAVEGSMTVPLGSIAYAKGYLEIFNQFSAKKIKPDAIILATGSGGTQAGLLAGKILMNSECRIIGISVSENKKSMTECIRKITRQTLSAMSDSPPEIDRNDIIVLDDYLGGGYGIVTPEITRTISRVAETEGILLDPVYTAKAMTGLLELLESGYFALNKNVVFWHTGGLPALFA